MSERTVDMRAIVAASIVEYYGDRDGRRILEEVGARYQGQLPLEAFVSLTLREAARLRWGSTEEWDAAASALGFDASVYERQRAVTA